MRFRHIVTSIVAATFVTFSTVPSADAAAIVRTTAFGSGADAYVREDQGGTNYGGAAVLQVKNDSANRRLVYTRFDISGLGVGITPANLDSVTLSLTTQNAFASLLSSAAVEYTLFGLVNTTDADRAPVANATTGGWNELPMSSITWSNAPGRTGASITTNSASPLGTPSSYGVNLGTFTLNNLAANTTFSIGAAKANSTHLSSLADNMLNFVKADTNGLVTFVLRRNTSNSEVGAFHSKENIAGTGAVNNAAFNPTLSVTVPEPASAALVGLMSIGLLVRRRHG